MILDAVVVGAGIGGLTAAHTLAEAGLRPLVLEAGGEIGGLVQRGRVGGYDVDLGAESFGLRRPEAAALVRRLGLEVETPATGSSVWRSGPDGPGQAVRIPSRTLLGIPADPLAADVVAVLGEEGARRAAGDLELGPAAGAESGSLAELVAARMGREVLERLVRPMVGGIHATEPEQLTVEAVAPGLRAALGAHGSLAGAVAALVPDGPAVGCVAGGMWRLPAALAGPGVTVRTGSRVTGVARAAGGTWAVGVAGGPDVRAHRLVLAAPGPEALDLLSGPLPTRGPALRAGTPLVHVTLVVDAPALDAAPVGSGVLVGPGEHDVRARALTQLTAKWASLGRATAPGTHVLRLSYGRPGEDPARLEDVDVDTAVRDTEAVLGVPLGQGLVAARRVVRARGIPPATADEPALRSLLDDVRATEGLAVCGAWVAGTGIAAVVPHAELEAQQLLAG